MGTQEDAACSSSSSSPRWIYDVFLSFRGEDTRKNFVDHLYAALCQKGIYTFKDDEKLVRGRSISPGLLRAIEESRFAVVVFSENYASSSWCLDELVKIIECKDLFGQTVFPVFYGVYPSQVRKQTGSFADSFTQHEVLLADKVGRVQEWRKALIEAANISGWDVQNTANGHESICIQQIVGCISKELDATSSADTENLYGIESRAEEVISLLNRRLDNVCVLGLWGLGGVGKTTIARVVFDQISSQFESSCYLENVREVSKSHHLGLQLLQEKLLADVLIEPNAKVINVHKGTDIIKRRLKNRRILLVLDDVDDIEQLNVLAGKRNWFGCGSRVIVATRNKQLLISFQVDSIYEVKVLNSVDATQLFSINAFKRNNPLKAYEELSDRLVCYCGGLPLALKILGSFLFGRGLDEWESAVNRLQENGETEILDVLKISYDQLHHLEKKIFLDIACFFKGMNKNHVAKMLGSFDFNPDIGISVLCQWCLITIADGRILMHDLVQEMGWDIVRQESLEEPGKRSRLWISRDIYHVMTEDTGAEAVECISLKHFVGAPTTKFVLPGSKSFKRMKRLRLLQICNLVLPPDFSYLSNQLRYVDWRGYNLEHLPPSFKPEKLVEFQMHNSHIKQLWTGTVELYKLKLLDLSQSSYLVKTPEFTGMSNLERLILEGCTGLVEIHPTLGALRKLVSLNLKDCKRLMCLPHGRQLESLQVLVLSGCSNLKSVSEILENTKCLSDLFLDGTGIRELTLPIEHLSNLSLLNLSNCKNLVSLSSTTCRLRNLRTFVLSGCTKLDKLPENLGELKCLEELHVDGTAIMQPPPSIVLLKRLKILSFHGCNGTAAPRTWASRFLSLLLPNKSSRESTVLALPSLSGLTSLKNLDLSDCNLAEGTIPSDLCCLSALEELNLSGNDFITLPETISGLSQLMSLVLVGCKKLVSLSNLPPSIQAIDANNCSLLEYLSDSAVYKSPQEFTFSNCYKLMDNKYSNGVVSNLFQHQLQGLTASTAEFNIVLPGREIPEFFNHQTDTEHSLMIQLPPYWYKNLLGFAVCAAFEASAATHPSAELHWYWGSYRDTDNSFDEFRSFYSIHRKRHVDSDHMCLRYMPFGLLPLNQDQLESCDYFGVTIKSSNPEFKPIRCGIRLVYVDDVKWMAQPKSIQYAEPVHPESSSVYDEEFEGSTKKPLVLDKTALEEERP